MVGFVGGAGFQIAPCRYPKTPWLVATMTIGGSQVATFVPLNFLVSAKIGGFALDEDILVESNVGCDVSFRSCK